MSVACIAMVIIGYRRADHSPIEVRCGTWNGGEQEFCDTCEDRFQAKYPQGWRGYPGDTCKHGVYVGGCGVDWTCPKCEFPDDEETTRDRSARLPDGYNDDDPAFWKRLRADEDALIAGRATLEQEDFRIDVLSLDTERAS